MLNDKYILCKYLGGSHSYGLTTPQSDEDVRGVYLSTAVSEIVGLDKNEHQIKQNSEEDTQLFEFRHFLKLLRNGNTQALEMLYNHKWLSVSPQFKGVQDLRAHLIDSHRLFKCLMGYCQSERRLVLGERTGVLGGKRREHLDTYGYSYKNAVQFLRLCRAGEVFFQKGEFPVDITSYDTSGIIRDVKLNPKDYTKDKDNTSLEEKSKDCRKCKF